MSPKIKKKQFPPVRVEEELYNETKRLSDDKDIYICEYIRQAIREKNAREKSKNDILNEEEWETYI